MLYVDDASIMLRNRWQTGSLHTPSRRVSAERCQISEGELCFPQPKRKLFWVETKRDNSRIVFWVLFSVRENFQEIIFARS